MSDPAATSFSKVRLSERVRPASSRSAGGACRWRIAMLFAALVSSSACSIVGDIAEVADVRAWERDVLAQEHMRLDGDAMDEQADEHIYFSKEASTGGGSVRGGGCGCN